MLAIGSSMQHTPTPPGPQTNSSPHPPLPATSSIANPLGNLPTSASASAASTPFQQYQQLPATSSTSSPSLSNSSIPQAQPPSSHLTVNQSSLTNFGNVSPFPPTNGVANPP